MKNEPLDSMLNNAADNLNRQQLCAAGRKPAENDSCSQLCASFRLYIPLEIAGVDTMPRYHASIPAASKNSRKIPSFWMSKLRIYGISSQKIILIYLLSQKCHRNVSLHLGKSSCNPSYPSSRKNVEFHCNR